MKRFILSIFLFVTSLIAFSQEKNSYNFFTQDGDVVWQKVFPTEMDTASVFTSIKTSGRLTDITETEAVLTGRMVEIIPEFASLGYSRGGVPIFIHFPIGGFVKVEMREGRYRVTINRMYRIDDSTPARERTDFTFYVNKKGALRFFPETAQEIYNHNFTKMFEVKPKIEEDW